MRRASHPSSAAVLTNRHSTDLLLELEVEKFAGAADGEHADRGDNPDRHGPAAARPPGIGVEWPRLDAAECRREATHDLLRIRHAPDDDEEQDQPGEVQRLPHEVDPGNTHDHAMVLQDRADMAEQPEER